MRNRLWRRLLEGPRSTDREAGFTVIEVMVAMGILTIILTVMAGTLTSSVRPVLLSKQRAVATAKAQQILEQARSLKYADVGLVATDASLPQNGGTDANVTNVGGTWKFGGEALAFAQNTASNPFNPHYVASFKSSSTTLTWWVWVTQAGNLRRVTVRVQWLNPAIASAVPFVRASTLVSNTGFTAASTPLTSAATADLGKVSVGAVIGSVADAINVSPGSSCGTDCGVTSLGVRNEVTCSGRTLSLDRSFLTGGSMFGGLQANTLADDDPATAAGTTANDSKSNPSPVPSDIYPVWLSQATAPGSTTCMSSVLGSDGVTGGVADLPYEHGTTSGPAHLSLAKTLTGTLATLIPAGLTILDQTDTNLGTAEGETTSTMSPGAIAVNATSRSADIRAIVLNIPTAALAAPYGILRVEALTASANATGQISGSPPAPSVSSATLRLWIYDPANVLSTPAVCTRRSNPLAVPIPEPAGYCIVDHDVSSPTALLPIPLDEPPIGVPITGPKIHFKVSITEGAPSTTTQTGSRGTTWTASVKPLSATVGLCVTTLGTSDCTPDGTVDIAHKLLDVNTTIDLGTVKAQAVYGFPV